MTPTTLTYSFYSHHQLASSSFDAPRVQLFTHEFLRHVLLPAAAPPPRTVSEHPVIQRICANGTHLGLRANMTDQEFRAHYVAARARVFSTTMEQAVARRKCVWCGGAYQRLNTVGRLHCRRHTGYKLDAEVAWSCCGQRKPCTPCDHSDVGTELSFSVLHVALLTVFCPLPENIVIATVDAMRVATEAIMMTAEAKAVGGAMVYIRINK
jgi:hypothetical protein